MPDLPAHYSAARAASAARGARAGELRWQVRRLRLYLEDAPRRDIPLPRVEEVADA